MNDKEKMGNPADESGEDGDAEEHIELTPEQEEALRRTMESIQLSLAPKIQLPEFTFPESTLKNVAAISPISETQRAMAARAIKPFLNVQAARQKQFSVINSDIFKSHALVQSHLNLVASQLIRNMDFGVAESVARVAAKFAAQQTAWLENIAPTIAAMFEVGWSDGVS